MEPQKRVLRRYSYGGKDLVGEWLLSLKDPEGVAAIARRLDRLEDGNFGDHRGVGGGVFELRIHCGPGYRVYCGEDGPVLVILLCGGDKSTQRRDIRQARRLWSEYRSGI